MKTAQHDVLTLRSCCAKRKSRQKLQRCVRAPLGSAAVPLAAAACAAPDLPKPLTRVVKIEEAWKDSYHPHDIMIVQVQLLDERSLRKMLNAFDKKVRATAFGAFAAAAAAAAAAAIVVCSDAAASADAAATTPTDTGMVVLTPASPSVCTACSPAGKGEPRAAHEVR